jgi:hypothetical protein
MKNLQVRLLPILIVCISLFNTAFIIQSTTNIEQKIPLSIAEAPPQYKSPKLTFFERLILKRILKKSKPNQTINLDAAVADAKKIARIGLVLLILSPLVLFLISKLSVFLAFISIIMGVLLNIASIVFNIIAISRASFVLNHTEVTGIQEQGAKKARTNGYCGLTVGVILAGLIVLLLRSFLR